jgi:hypothetical protein
MATTATPKTYTLPEAAPSLQHWACPRCGALYSCEGPPVPECGPCGDVLMERVNVVVTRIEGPETRAERAEAQLAEAREALEFYAPGIGFSEREDNGDTARAALAKLGGWST